MTKKLMVSAAATMFLAGLLMAPVANAATAQQERMKTCNADAKTKSLAGDERKAFMKSCLSGKKAEESSAKTTQQQKMKDCNAQAKTKALKGNDRKTFMSTCLKG